jgi:adenosylmethionine-8-amino-7-oxononanoate aminotransferase
MSHVLYRDSRRDPPRAMRGDGLYLIDAQGKRYLDASGGAAVSCLGHGDARVQQAIRNQLEQLEYAHTSFFTSEPAEQLADTLIADAPAGMDKVLFVSGGSEGMEAAIKMARQYFIEVGEPQRRHVIARRQSYHGSTLGALSAGGNMWRREPYQPLLFEASHIAPCFPYHFKQRGESDEQYGLRVANDLEAEIQRLGTDSVAAFIAETVVGATAGAVAAVPGYFRRIREICDQYGVLLILDEVMCGMGRTGTLHACVPEDMTPDLLVVAKGLGAGYQPIGAMLVQKKVHEAFERGSGYFQHGHTYLGHPVACAAALAVQRVIKQDGLLANVQAMGTELMGALRERFGAHPHVGDVRGRGLLQAVELVQDRAARQPFDPALQIHARIKREALARGLIVYPMGGTIDGKLGDHVLLAPPFNIDAGHVEIIVELLAAAIDAALAPGTQQAGTT